MVTIQAVLYAQFSDFVEGVRISMMVLKRKRRCLKDIHRLTMIRTMNMTA
jgi:hypothetical protein